MDPLASPVHLRRHRIIRLLATAAIRAARRIESEGKGGREAPQTGEAQEKGTN